MAGFEIDLVHYVILFVAAVFAGFINAIVGGGGLIAIPAMLASGVPVHLAIATAKIQALCGLFSASVAYYKFVNMQSLGLCIVCNFVGGALGTFAVLLVDEKPLKIVILVCLVLTFAYMALKPQLGRQAQKPKIRNIKLFHFTIGFALGFYDGFLGAGGGLFWVFALVVLLGFDMRNASINMQIPNFASSLASLLIFVWQFEVLWGLGILMGLGQIVGVYIGSKLVLKTNGHFIKWLFLSVVGATICKVGYDFIVGG